MKGKFYGFSQESEINEAAIGKALCAAGNFARKRKRQGNGCL